MEKKTNYNWVSQAGLDSVDDMEVVRALELDPKYAYTPAINKVAVEAAKLKSYQGYMDQGLTVKEAKMLADEHYKDALNTIKEMEDQTGKKFL